MGNLPDLLEAGRSSFFAALFFFKAIYVN